MSLATPKHRAEARIGPMIPDGWVLDPPEPFDKGWRLGIHSEADPEFEIGVWRASLEAAIMALAEAIEAERPPN